MNYFNIEEYGAIGEGVTKNTVVIQKAENQFIPFMLPVNYVGDVFKSYFHEHSCVWK